LEPASPDVIELPSEAPSFEPESLASHAGTAIQEANTTPPEGEAGGIETEALASQAAPALDDAEASTRETEPTIGAATVRERSDIAPILVAPEPEAVIPEPTEIEAAPLLPPVEPASTSPALQAHWMLSLFTPAAADTVDWARGNYTVLARGGRIDSPSGSGELKKQIQMVAEGSVLFADGAPLGAAPDVAPDGFAHPVFRAGFALTIPLPEVH
jgi:hypothetical protein